MDSDAEVDGGDQGNWYSDFLGSVQEGFGLPTDTKLANVLERIWGKAKFRDLKKEELEDTLIHKNFPFMKPLC